MDGRFLILVFTEERKSKTIVQPWMAAHLIFAFTDERKE